MNSTHKYVCENHEYKPQTRAVRPFNFLASIDCSGHITHVYRHGEEAKVTSWRTAHLAAIWKGSHTRTFCNKATTW